MGQAIEVHGAELILPEIACFPFREARNQQLMLFRDPQDLSEAKRVEPLDTLPFEAEVVIEPRTHRNESITLARFVQFGPTDGCSACSDGGYNHNKACRERFNKLILSLIHI